MSAETLMSLPSASLAFPEHVNRSPEEALQNLQDALDDGSAMRIGPAVVGREVRSSTRRALREMNKSGQLGAAVISGRVSLRNLDGYQTSISDGSVIHDATIHGSTIDESLVRGGKVRRSRLERATVTDSTIDADTQVLGATVTRTRLYDSAVDAGSTIADSDLDNSVVTGSDVSNVTQDGLQIYYGTRRGEQNLT